MKQRQPRRRPRYRRFTVVDAPDSRGFREFVKHWARLLDDEVLLKAVEGGLNRFTWQSRPQLGWLWRSLEQCGTYPLEPVTLLKLLLNDMKISPLALLSDEDREIFQRGQFRSKDPADDLSPADKRALEWGRRKDRWGDLKREDFESLGPKAEALLAEMAEWISRANEVEKTVGSLVTAVTKALEGSPPPVDWRETPF